MPHNPWPRSSWASPFLFSFKTSRYFREGTEILSPSLPTYSLWRGTKSMSRDTSSLKKTSITKMSWLFPLSTSLLRGRRSWATSTDASWRRSRSIDPPSTRPCRQFPHAVLKDEECCYLVFSVYTEQRSINDVKNLLGFTNPKQMYPLPCCTIH